MTKFEKQRQQANAFKCTGKSLPAFVNEDDDNNGWVDEDAVLTALGAGILFGCRYMVRTPLKKNATLQRCFAEPADAKDYADYMRRVAKVSWANIFRLNSNGRDDFYCYAWLTLVDFIDFERPQQGYYSSDMEGLK